MAGLRKVFLAEELSSTAAAIVFRSLTNGQQMTVLLRHATVRYGDNAGVYVILLNGKSHAKIQTRGQRFSRVMRTISWFGLGSGQGYPPWVGISKVVGVMVIAAVCQNLITRWPA